MAPVCRCGCGLEIDTRFYEGKDGYASYVCREMDAIRAQRLLEREDFRREADRILSGAHGTLAMAATLLRIKEREAYAATVLASSIPGVTLGSH